MAKNRNVGKSQKDSSRLITCLVADPVRSYSITFDSELLALKKEKYGSRLIVPSDEQVS
jgi:hypothetical protein